MTAGPALWRYHEATKHSPQSVAAGRRRLDWAIKPRPFKIYRELAGTKPPDDIGRLCALSNGVLRWRPVPGGEPYGFRAAPCTGALYHHELYLATAERGDLAAGLFHYGAHDYALRQLRSGDVRAALLDASGGFEPIRSAPLVVVLTSTFWRNAWKYEARAYRHAYWDGGAILANLLALLAADATPASIVMGFADAAVNRLVGADGEREAAIALVAVGEGAEAPIPPGDLAELAPATEPLSSHEIKYPQIEAAHRASSLDSGPKVRAWRARADGASHVVPPPVAEGIEQVIKRRRSSRRLSGKPIERDQLDAVLEAATLPIPGDTFAPDPIEPFLILNGVDQLEAGAYRSDLSPIRLGNFCRVAAELALGQDLGAEAAANLYLLADPERLFGRLGERGYRVAQIAGGIAGGRIELAATALGLGATGLTFFDDEVTRFFEPASAGRLVIYLAALGSLGDPDEWVPARSTDRAGGRRARPSSPCHDVEIDRA